MPWDVGDVDDHMKGLSASKKKTWVEVANKALAACEKAGKEDCDASAIKQANAVVGKLSESISLRDKLRQALEEDSETAMAWLTESESYTKLMSDVGDAVKKTASDKGWAFIEELFDDFVVYQKGAPNEETQYFKALYSVATDGTITLGESTEVKKVTSYPMAEAAERSDMDFVEIGAGQLIPWEEE